MTSVTFLLLGTLAFVAMKGVQGWQGRRAYYGSINAPGFRTRHADDGLPPTASKRDEEGGELKRSDDEFPPSANRRDDEGGELKRAACATPPPFSDAEKQAIVDRHNLYRRNISSSSMRLMQWDDDLACEAQAYAEKCTWAHDPNNGDGENLAYNGGDTVFSTYRWAQEADDYDYATGGCTTGKMCGHYTQVVWADTYKLGCGMVNCATMSGSSATNTNLHVCRYSPPGNYPGVKPYKTGDVCSACSGSPWCEKTGDPNPLCLGESTKDSPNTRCMRTCQNGGVVGCDCNCKCNGYFGDHCESLCEDDASHASMCPGWKSLCDGLAYPSIPRVCKKTCGKCQGAFEADASFVDCNFAK